MSTVTRKAKLELESIGASWRNSKKAWMNTINMKEWLHWLNARVKAQGKHILLLMDNFSAHEAAILQMEQANELTNIKVKFLPSNTISEYQALD